MSSKALSDNALDVVGAHMLGGKADAARRSAPNIRGPRLVPTSVRR